MTPTPEQGAAMWEAAHRLRAELRHISGTHRLARIKIESPELIEAVQEVADALDAVDPPQQLPGFFP